MTLLKLPPFEGSNIISNRQVVDTLLTARFNETCYKIFFGEALSRTAKMVMIG